LRQHANEIGHEFLAERTACLEQFRQIVLITAGVGIADHRQGRRANDGPIGAFPQVRGQYLAHHQ